MCMNCYMRELMLYESSNVKELDDKMTEAQQSKSFAVVNLMYSIFNDVIKHNDVIHTCEGVQF